MLNCYYEHKKHPYFKINPLKIELLNKKPKVIQVHDLFKDSERFAGQSSFSRRSSNKGLLKLVEYLTGLSTTGSKFEFSFNGLGSHAVNDRIDNDKVVISVILSSMGSTCVYGNNGK